MCLSWPWWVVAGLGMYHGLNPAMGWLFAVALGLHRGRRAVVVQALVPIAIGHAAAIGLVAAAFLLLGFAANPGVLHIVAGSALILWAFYHLLYGHRHRARIGMRAGFFGLVAWSFLMAAAHGAGLMLAPALIPLLAVGQAGGAGAWGPLATSAVAVGVHTAAMLAVTGAIAVAVYEWLGLGFLTRGWLNLDKIWNGTLFATGFAVLATAV